MNPESCNECLVENVQAAFYTTRGCLNLNFPVRILSKYMYQIAYPKESRNIRMKGATMLSRNPFKTLMFIPLFVALAFCMSNSSYAQRGRPSLEERVKRLTEQLSLSKTQADSVKSIYQAADQERANLFKDQSGDRSSIREAMGKIMQNADAKIDSLLTSDQKAKFDQLRKDRPRRMGSQGRGMQSTKDSTKQK